MDMTQLLSVVSGVLISLAMSYIPPFRDWWDTIEPNLRRLYMLGFLLLAAAVIYGLSCWRFVAWVTCDEPGIRTLLEAFVLAAIANQTAFQLSPKETHSDKYLLAGYAEDPTDTAEFDEQHPG